MKFGVRKYYCMRLVIFIFYFSLSVFSQGMLKNSKIDSIEQLVKQNLHDTVKAKCLLELANLYQDIDLEISKKKASAAFTIIEKTDYRRGLNFYYVIKCRENILLNDIDKSLAFAKKAQINSLKTNDLQKYAYGCYYEAILYTMTNEYSKCIEAINRLLKYLNAKAKNNFMIVGDLYMTLGSAYSRNSQNDKAIESFKKSIIFYNKQNDTNGLHNSYYEIAQIYLVVKNTKKALEYCNKAITINQDSGNYSIRDNCTDLILLSLIYTNLKEYKKAIYYVNKAQNDYKKIGGELDKWFSFHSMVNIYQETGKTEAVLKLCQSELKNHKEQDENLLLLYNYVALAYQAENRNELAVKYIEKIFNLLKKDTTIYVADENKIILHGNASKVYYAAGQYKNAYNHLNQYLKINEEINERFNQQKVQQLQEEFNTKENEATISNLKIKEQQKSIEAEKQRNKYYVTALVLICISLLLLFCLYAGTVLKKKNNVLNKYNSVIEIKNNQLEKLVDKKNILLREVHHRVKNNLQLIMSLLNIQARVNKHPDVDKFLDKGQSRIKAMALVHQNLYQTDNVGYLDFAKYIKDILSTSKECYADTVENIKISTKIQEVQLNIHQAIPVGLILNELMCNTIKHAFPNKRAGEVFIEAKKLTNNNVEITFYDNGVGYKDQNQGMGLKIVSLLAQQLNANLIANSKDTGTKYTLIFTIE